MDKIGAKLQAVRVHANLSLRDVEELTSRLASTRRNPLCKISASWLNRIENNDHTIGSAKLLTLAHIYKLSVEELLAFGDALNEAQSASQDLELVPSRCLLIPRGPLHDRAQAILPDEAAESEPSRTTTFLDSDVSRKLSRYVRAVVGTDDNYLHPMLRPGAIVLVDRRKRNVAPTRAFNSEFERPIYLLDTHGGHLCSWCEFDEQDRNIVTIVPHPCSGKKGKRLHAAHDLSVVGQVISVRMRVGPIN